MPKIDKENTGTKEMEPQEVQDAAEATIDENDEESKEVPDFAPRDS